MSADERNPEPSNPLGIDGIEFVEYATSQPQAFGALLQKMGFAAVARHRSREVVLFRQGTMNLIVNAHDARNEELTDANKTPRTSLEAGVRCGIWPGGNLLSRADAHYHRRKPVSRSCSGWEGVGPGCCGRQMDCRRSELS